MTCTTTRRTSRPGRSTSIDASSTATGPNARPRGMAAVIQSAEREYARLEERLSVDDPELARRYRERCAQATEEGLPGRQVRSDPSSPAEMTVDSRGKWGDAAAHRG